MIKISKQVWEIGEVVRVGFMQLRVVEKVPTPGDFKPDAYVLCGLGANAHKKYNFVPHNGLSRVRAQKVQA